MGAVLPVQGLLKNLHYQTQHHDPSGFGWSEWYRIRCRKNCGTRGISEETPHKILAKYTGKTEKQVEKDQIVTTG